MLDSQDPQHGHYALPENEIWIFKEGGTPGAPDGQGGRIFPPITIKEVRRTQLLDDPEIDQILANPSRGFGGEPGKGLQGLNPDTGEVEAGSELDNARRRCVILTLWSSLVGKEGEPCAIKMTGPDTDPSQALEGQLLNHKVLVEPPPPTVDEIADMEGMKNELRSQIDTLFIEVTFRLGKILNQINALEYRVCALEDNPMNEADLPPEVREIGVFASADEPYAG